MHCMLCGTVGVMGNDCQSYSRVRVRIPVHSAQQVLPAVGMSWGVCARKSFEQAGVQAIHVLYATVKALQSADFSHTVLTKDC